MKRSTFLKAIASTVGVGALMSPLVLKAKEEDDLEEVLMTWEEFDANTSPKIVSFEKESRWYLNNKVKEFKQATLTVLPERPDLQIQFYSQAVEGSIKRKHLKEFCENINKYADQGLIEYAALAPVCALALAGAGYRIAPNRYLSKDFPKMILLYYNPFSRFDLKQLRHLTSLHSGFNAEGELTTSKLK